MVYHPLHEKKSSHWLTFYWNYVFSLYFPTITELLQKKHTRSYKKGYVTVLYLTPSPTILWTENEYFKEWFHL